MFGYDPQAALQAGNGQSVIVNSRLRAALKHRARASHCRRNILRCHVYSSKGVRSLIVEGIGHRDQGSGNTIWRIWIKGQEFRTLGQPALRQE
jgi:hypothetical protein